MASSLLDSQKPIFIRAKREYYQSKKKHRQGNTHAEQDPLQIRRCFHVCHDRIEHRRFHPFIENGVFCRFTHAFRNL